MRELPKMDRNTIGPFADVSLLDFYSGVFNCVFVSLNPFLQLLDSSTLKLSNFWEIDDRNSIDIKQRILLHTKPIRWEEILMISGFQGINQIDIALRTSIGGLVKLKQDWVLEEILDNAMENNQILAPTEGRIPENQINSILKAIKKQGYEWICLGAEFGDSMELVWIDDLIQDQIDYSTHQNLYTYDRKILISCHWDSFQVYICSNPATVKSIVKDALLEGFYANEKTEVYWSVKND